MRPVAFRRRRDEDVPEEDDRRVREVGVTVECVSMRPNEVCKRPEVEEGSRIGAESLREKYEWLVAAACCTGAGFGVGGNVVRQVGPLCSGNDAGSPANKGSTNANVARRLRRFDQTCPCGTRSRASRRTHPLQSSWIGTPICSRTISTRLRRPSLGQHCGRTWAKCGQALRRAPRPALRNGKTPGLTRGFSCVIPAGFEPALPP